MSGCLYIVATPIGNLEDVTLRALRILREASVVACEDTRVTRKLFARHEITTPLVPIHAHSSDADYERLLARVTAGETVGYVSDAGEPIVSDPAGELVRRAVALELRVEPIPGPSAVLAALTGAGLFSGRFAFFGFLPKGEGAQRELLAPYRTVPLSLVFFESPQRLHKLLSRFAGLFGGGRAACVARELTKRFETFERGTLDELAERYVEPPKGEVVVIVGPSEDDAASEDDVRAEARRLLDSGVGANEAAKMLAGAHGLRKKDVYRMILDLQVGGLSR